MSSGVAVVIPAFRSHGYLAGAVRSALEQTLPPDEVVVVDDGSPEPLAAELRGFGDRVLYARQSNRGPGAARNLGVRLTSAPLVAFLDDDDVWEPPKLAVQVAFLAEHPECAAVCSDAWVVSDGAEVYRRDRRRLGPRPPDLSFEGLLRDNGVATLTVLVRREALEAVGGFDEDRDLIAVEDYDLWLRLAERYPIGYVDAALARYHRRNGSLSGPRRFLEGVCRVLAKTMQRHARLAASDRSSRDLRAIVRDREQELQLDLAWQLLESDQAGQALVPILEALALSPRRARAWKLLARAGAASFGLGRARQRLARRP